MNACGYSLSATYAPNWMDWPMLFHGTAVEAEPDEKRSGGVLGSESNQSSESDGDEAAMTKEVIVDCHNFWTKPLSAI